MHIKDLAVPDGLPIRRFESSRLTVVCCGSFFFPSPGGCRVSSVFGFDFGVFVGVWLGVCFFCFGGWWCFGGFWWLLVLVWFLGGVGGFGVFGAVVGLFVLGGVVLGLFGWVGLFFSFLGGFFFVWGGVVCLLGGLGKDPNFFPPNLTFRALPLLHGVSGETLRAPLQDDLWL